MKYILTVLKCILFDSSSNPHQRASISMASICGAAPSRRRPTSSRTKLPDRDTPPFPYYTSSVTRSMRSPPYRSPHSSAPSTPPASPPATPSWKSTSRKRAFRPWDGPWGVWRRPFGRINDWRKRETEAMYKGMMCVL